MMEQHARPPQQHPRSQTPPVKKEKRPRTRAALPKVRTGCITCKVRRVKCDEARPSCNRCKKFGIKCDGFLVLPPPRAPYQSRKTSNRPLVPYRMSNTDVSLSTRIFGTPRFQSPEEHRFFQLYITKSTTHLSGFYDPSLWNQIVLQASEQEESIRHAVISIGALDMSATAGQAKRKEKEMEDHYVFALKQYSKAINALRQKAKILGAKYDLRTALVASLLIVCFETYHGNWESANRQTKATMRLLDSRKAPLTPTKDCEVEEELVRAFDRLDSQSMCERDIYTLDEHMYFLNCHADKLATMPKMFEDVSTARNYFNLIVRETMHFACAFWAVHAPTPSPLTLSSITEPSMRYLHIDMAMPCISEDFRAMRVIKLGHLERWMEACRSLFEVIVKRRKKGCKDRLAVVALRAQYLMAEIMMKVLGTVREMDYDAFLDEFREIVDLCEELEAHCMLADANKEDGKVYVFDMQSVMPLDFIARKCRDPTIRRRAIGLLKGRPRRELFWDSVIASKVCEWVVGVEEEGLVDGFVREENRARDVTIGPELRGVAVGPEVAGGDEAKGAKIWCTLGTGVRREGIVQW